MIAVLFGLALIPAFANAFPAYCSDRPSLSKVDLYEEPPCSQAVAQFPDFNSSIEYEAAPIHNLSFCCNSNYTALLPAGADPEVLDDEARDLFQTAARFLSRYDCLQFYPFHSCEPCLQAYRTWVCSVTFPMKCLGRGSVALQVCNDVCLEVQRKCPSEMHFFCPMDDNTDDGGDGQYGPWKGGNDVLYGRGGCNPMQYNLGPGSPHSGTTIRQALHTGIAAIALALLF